MLVLGLAGGLGLAVFGVTGYFRLSGEAAALRESAMASIGGNWDKKLALHVGWVTTSLVRAGAHLFKLPPEPQAALDSLRGGEVGIYKLHENAGWVDHRAILARADKAMAARRWDRVMGVSREDELVAVYVPRRGLSEKRMSCSVLVLQGRDLIVAGGSGNLQPLLEIAGKHIDLNKPAQHLALR